jgi:hypothetical protein
MEFKNLGFNKQINTTTTEKQENKCDLHVVVKSFYCFEESMNGYLKCDSECSYCKAIKKKQ